MRAYAIALQPPAGPVFSHPLDDWGQESTVPLAVRSVASRVRARPARLAEFAAAFAAAENPALVLGADVARGDGWHQAVVFAERLGVKVWAAPACERPPFPEDHPLYAGGLPFAQGLLSQRLAGHDVILVIGAAVFRYYPWVAGDYVPDGARLLHITSDPAGRGGPRRRQSRRRRRAGAGGADGARPTAVDAGRRGAPKATPWHRTRRSRTPSTTLPMTRR